MRQFDVPPRNTVRLWLSALAVAVLAAASSRAGAQEAWAGEVDYTLLKNRLIAAGIPLPIGSGGMISQVEAVAPPAGSPVGTPATAHLVDETIYEFTSFLDPSLTAITLVPGSGDNGQNSNHATGVAFYYYGNVSSMAPGANHVTMYEADNWVQTVLHAGTTIAPQTQTFRVQNHSWVSKADIAANVAVSSLQRLDYLIETGDMTAAVGANNNFTPATLISHPALFAHSYNAIVVGRSDGGHSRGETSSLYGSGRFKPDIVAPGAGGTPTQFTSLATARVSSAAALLHQSVAGTDGDNSEVIKATLMAGATKGEFANFIDPTSGQLNSWDRVSPTQPLDDIFGAGELNIYNSYLIQLGGQQAGVSLAGLVTADPVSSYGWDYQDFKSQPLAGDQFYKFEVPDGSTAPELSIILAWNAEVVDTPAAGFTPSQSLQNLDLRLYAPGENVLIETGVDLRRSVSTVDNVEHIYLTDLPPGEYTLKVSGAGDWDYGLAWRMATKFNERDADFDGDGVVDGWDFLTWQRNYGTLLGASNSQGDADGDGDVDDDDYAAYRAGAMPAPVMVSAASAGRAAAAVPEPSAWLLAAAAVAGLAAAGRFSRQSAAKRLSSR